MYTGCCAANGDIHAIEISLTAQTLAAIIFEYDSVGTSTSIQRKTLSQSKKTAALHEIYFSFHAVSLSFCTVRMIMFDCALYFNAVITDIVCTQ